MTHNKQGHTPGPWHINPHGNEIEVWTGATVLCLCHRTLQGLADAKLIAAAPELLKALTIVCGWFEATAGKHVKVMFGDAGKAVLDNARAAIAKAEGKV